MQGNDHRSKYSVLLAVMNDSTTKTLILLPHVVAPVLAPEAVPVLALPTLTACATYQHLENDLVTCVYRKIRGYEELRKILPERAVSSMGGRKTCCGRTNRVEVLL